MNGEKTITVDGIKAVVVRKRVKNVILGHLSQENNYPALAMIAVRSVLEEAGIANDMQIAVAAREEPTGVFEIL